MTTTVKVHVNGNYKASVTRNGETPVIIDATGVEGGVEQSFSMAHPAAATFSISEEATNPAPEADEEDEHDGDASD